MVTFVDGDLVLCLHTEREPTDEEWSEYVGALASMRPRIRSLVVTDGGGPSPLQRKRAMEAARGTPSLVAVVTSSRVVRGIITAVSWFGVEIRAFAPAELGEAFRFLELGRAEIERLWRLVERGRAELGGPSPRVLTELPAQRSASLLAPAFSPPGPARRRLAAGGVGVHPPILCTRLRAPRAGVGMVCFHEGTMLDELERTLNWLSDNDAEWWPFLFLRPEPHERMTNARVAQLAVLYGVLVGMVANLMLAFAGHRANPMAFPAGVTLGLFVLFRFTIGWAWNRRAARFVPEGASLSRRVRLGRLARGAR